MLTASSTSKIATTAPKFFPRSTSSASLPTTTSLNFRIRTDYD